MSINQELQSMLDQVRQATAEVQAATREQRDAREQDRKEHAKEDDAIASKRRNGEMGRDWQTLQQRIDMNKTTFSDIVSGVDLSDEARRVRKLIQTEVLPRARGQFAEAMGADDFAAEADGLRQAQQDLAAAMRTVQDPQSPTR